MTTFENKVCMHRIKSEIEITTDPIFADGLQAVIKIYANVNFVEFFTTEVRAF